MPPLEAWEKVFVSEKLAQDEHHGKISCVQCHKGKEGENTKEEAHQGLIRDPSSGATPSCATSGCHEDISAKHAKSIHGTQQGFMTSLARRQGLVKPSKNMMNMHQSACAACHTTCGQCHISRPTSVKGGLISGHVFKKRPNQNLNCIACHGSRIGEEYRGMHEGIAPDVHYLKQMTCFDCHSGEEMHGDGTTPAHRYDVKSAPTCLGCHKKAIDDPDNQQHAIHKGKVSCNVCHSLPYKNCFNCHVGKDKVGLKFPSKLDFRIALNPMKDAKRPWDYVLVRHVPISLHSFSEWGAELPAFTSAPTWRFATPHNIQKKTPQNASCDACHGKKELFLTKAVLDKLIVEGAVLPEEVTANAAILVKKLP